MFQGERGLFRAGWAAHLKRDSPRRKCRYTNYAFGPGRSRERRFGSGHARIVDMRAGISILATDE